MYQGEAIAAGYAFDRPPVHEHIVRRLRLGRVRRALDIGCGAGLSAAVLRDVAEEVFGLEPERAMLAHREAVAPGAQFVVGRAEAMPFAAGSFELVTAAGALNYVDLPRFLPELRRVLAPGGMLVVYDFGEGRRGSERLEQWWEAFERLSPGDSGYEFDVMALGPTRHEVFDVVVPMTFDGYLRYALTEKPEVSHGWCEATLTGVFDQPVIEVRFEAYLAEIRQNRPPSAI